MADTIKVGDIAKFRGYATDPGENPALNPGDLVKIAKTADDGGFQAVRCDAQGNATDLDADGNVIGEIVFPEELEALPPAEATVATPAPVAADAPAAPAKAAKGKGKKAETKAPVEAAPVPAAAEAVKPAKVAKAPKADKGTKIKPAAETTPAAVTAAIKPVAGTIVFQHSSLVMDVLASVAGTDGNEQQAALIAARQLVNRVDETYYTLGGVLHYIKEQGTYKSIGYDGKRGFADYVRAELDVDYRKAQDLISIYETVQRSGLNEARLAEIGWSKARQIVRIGSDGGEGMTRLQADFDQLIDFAKEKTRDELIGKIKSEYETIATRGGVKVKKTSFSFHLVAEQAASVEAGLEEAKALAGSDDLSEAFAYIVNDWRMMSAGNTLTPEQQIAALADRLGVTLTVGPAANAAGEDAVVTAG